MIGRAAAIFRVEEIIIYQDALSTTKKDSHVIASILNYLETPQYLRKRLFKITPVLRYVGILPPLRTPHHQLLDKVKRIRGGECREGVVISVSKQGSLVDVGLDCRVLIRGKKLKLNKRVTVKIRKPSPGRDCEAVLIRREKIKSYWGYRTMVQDVSLSNLVINSNFDLVIATSRHGAQLGKVEEDLTKMWEKARSILIIFGAPTRGLYEIAAQEHVNLDENVDFSINTVPNQGTSTVRTEEAVYATLAIFNWLCESRVLKNPQKADPQIELRTKNGI